MFAKNMKKGTHYGHHVTLTTKYAMEGGIPDKKLKHFWKSRNDDDRITLEWEGLSCTNWVREDPEKCGETKERAIIRAVVTKLLEEWFSEVSRDKDDLKGIIDYLEPTLYEGFIDHNDKAYKIQKLRGNSRDRLDSYSFGNLVEFAAATKWFKKLVAYAKCNHDSYESELGDKEIQKELKFLVRLPEN
ncbi:hypothetical protein Tco_0292206 [Tanacetum coccineum]